MADNTKCRLRLGTVMDEGLGTCIRTHTHTCGIGTAYPPPCPCTSPAHACLPEKMLYDPGNPACRKVCTIGKCPALPDLCTEPKGKKTTSSTKSRSDKSTKHWTPVGPNQLFWDLPRRFLQLSSAGFVLPWQVWAVSAEVVCLRFAGSFNSGRLALAGEGRQDIARGLILPFRHVVGLREAAIVQG